MMHRFLVVFLLLVNICFGQKKIAYRQYLDKAWQVVDKPKEAVAMRIFDSVDGPRFHMVTLSIKDTQVIEEGDVLMVENGYKTIGTFKTYSTSGYLSSEGEYDSGGMPHGYWVGYYDSGDIWYSAKYEHGALNGNLTCYYNKTNNIKRTEKFSLGKSLGGTCYTQDGKETEFTSFISMPYPKYDFMKYLEEKLEYPEYERDAGIQGRAMVRFAIDADGSVKDAKVIMHVTKGIDDAALRVILLMPKWEPGTFDGTKVKVYYTQPISFKVVRYEILGSQN